jgi:hypothetical protein
MLLQVIPHRFSSMHFWQMANPHRHDQTNPGSALQQQHAALRLRSERCPVLRSSLGLFILSFS